MQEVGRKAVSSTSGKARKLLIIIPSYLQLPLLTHSVRMILQSLQKYNILFKHIIDLKKMLPKIELFQKFISSYGI
jgi:hypothetical protein